MVIFWGPQIVCNFNPFFSAVKQGMILVWEAKKRTHLNELDVKKPLVVSISQNREDWRGDDGRSWISLDFGGFFERSQDVPQKRQCRLLSSHFVFCLHLYSLWSIESTKWPCRQTFPWIESSQSCWDCDEMCIILPLLKSLKLFADLPVQKVYHPMWDASWFVSMLLLFRATEFLSTI